VTNGHHHTKVYQNHSYNCQVTKIIDPSRQTSQ